MKKISLLFVLMIILILASIYWVFNLYSINHTSSTENPNIHITTINYAIQIGYNIIYLMIGLAVLFVACFQLDKTREATTIQTLVNIDNYIKSDDFLRKRKRLAELVIDNQLINLSNWIKEVKLKNANELTLKELENIAMIKNIIEAVIYQFELVGHFYKKNIFSIEDIYQLFSVEIRNYWILINEIGYIDYLRENKINSSTDYYNKFQKLHNDNLIEEIINEARSESKYFLEFYYRTRMFKIFYRGNFYWLRRKTHNKIFRLINKTKKAINLFVLEEKNLID